MEWTDEISSMALSTLKTAKMNRPQRLPLTEDLQKLNECLNKDIEHHSKLLCDKVNVNSWYELAECTLAKVILFNRKRSGETERLLVESYTGRNKDTAPIADIENSLFACERL